MQFRCVLCSLTSCALQLKGSGHFGQRCQLSIRRQPTLHKNMSHPLKCCASKRKNMQAQASSCFTRPRAHHFLDASKRLMQNLCGNFGSPTQQNSAGICSTDSTLFIPGWGQQNEHLLQHLLRHAPGIKSVEFPKPFLLQSLFFVDQLVCSTFRRFGKSLARFVRGLFIRMPRDFQTSRGNSHLSDSDRGEFPLEV